MHQMDVYLMRKKSNIKEQKENVKLSPKNIKKIAWLARIELQKKEINLFTNQLNDILAYFAKIDEVNVENIPPAYHVLEIVNVLRKDEVKPSLEQTFQTVPQTKGRFVKAPKMT
ncbi:MAG: Asp-tRNA(Asn)/Glu-tRNA(Gln) amidotransferase subunit GatC [Candidatus Methylarchaceae archaeon HK02M2]|nr:Asp-tRNA(Asn)/Glu-tRNA(Gln) amidotransferase subunit GatC [Candidatus Methylarchaceae archaeon HK02M2]